MGAPAYCISTRMGSLGTGGAPRTPIIAVKYLPPPLARCDPIVVPDRNPWFGRTGAAGPVLRLSGLPCRSSYGTHRGTAPGALVDHPPTFKTAKKKGEERCPVSNGKTLGPSKGPDRSPL